MNGNGKKAAEISAKKDRLEEVKRLKAEKEASLKTCEDTIDAYVLPDGFLEKSGKDRSAKEHALTEAMIDGRKEDAAKFKTELKNLEAQAEEVNRELAVLQGEQSKLRATLKELNEEETALAAEIARERQDAMVIPPEQPVTETIGENGGPMAVEDPLAELCSAIVDLNRQRAQVNANATEVAARKKALDEQAADMARQRELLEIDRRESEALIRAQETQLREASDYRAQAVEAEARAAAKLSGSEAKLAEAKALNEKATTAEQRAKEMLEAAEDYRLRLETREEAIAASEGILRQQREVAEVKLVELEQLHADLEQKIVKKRQALEERELAISKEWDRLRVFEQGLAEHRGRLETEEQRLVELQGLVVSEQQRLRQVQSAVETAQALAEATRAECLKAERDAAERLRQLQVAEERIHEAEMSRDILAQAGEEALERVKQMTELTARLNESRGQLAEAQEKFNGAQALLDATRNELVGAKMEADETKAEIGRLQAELSARQAALAANLAELEKSRQNQPATEAAVAETERLRQLATDLQQQCQLFQRENSGLNNRLAHLESENTFFGSAVATAGGALNLEEIKAAYAVFQKHQNPPSDLPKYSSDLSDPAVAQRTLRLLNKSLDKDSEAQKKLEAELARVVAENASPLTIFAFKVALAMVRQRGYLMELLFEALKAKKATITESWSAWARGVVKLAAAATMVVVVLAVGFGAIFYSAEIGTKISAVAEQTTQHVVSGVVRSEAKVVSTLPNLQERGQEWVDYLSGQKDDALEEIKEKYSAWQRSRCVKKLEQSGFAAQTYLCQR